jgi:Toprim-like/CHC2 zinc finger
MNINQAQQIPLATLLSRLGYTPVKTYKGGVELAFRSPFRADTTASFFVNVHKNVWNDFGDSGGTVLDFVMRYRSTDVRGALNYLETVFGNSFFLLEAQIRDPSVKDPLKSETLILEQIKPFGTSPSLTDYIVEQRKINASVANQYLKEVHFKNSDSGKHYFAAAFSNDAGGFEIRNAFFKSSINGKDMTFLKGTNNDSIAVFEGFIDFLSYLTLKKIRQPETDALVLNSIAFKEKAVNLIKTQNYTSMDMWLNNDKMGKETLHFFIENTDCIVTPQNHLYLDFNDLNELLVFNTVKKMI